MIADQFLTLLLLVSPLCGLAVKEVRVDPIVQFVDVYGVDSIL